MSEEIITKRGNYGRVQVTLPMPVKLSMLNWAKRSGLKKSEFLQLAIIIGAAHLVGEVLAKGQKGNATPEGIRTSDHQAPKIIL